MKEFFDKADVFLAKGNPLICFLGIIIMCALIYNKLEQKWLATGRWGATKAILLLVYIIGSSAVAVFILAPLVPAWIGGIIGFFTATIAAAWAEIKADASYMKEYQRKMDAEILRRFGVNMN